jgi:hypothetical protein
VRRPRRTDTTRRRIYPSLFAPLPKRTPPTLPVSLLSSAAQTASTAPAPVIAVRTRCLMVHWSISAFVVSSCATPASAFASSASASAFANSLSLMGLRTRSVKGMMDGKRRVAAVLSLKGSEAGSSGYSVG